MSPERVLEPRYGWAVEVLATARLSHPSAWTRLRIFGASPLLARSASPAARLTTTGQSPVFIDFEIMIVGLEIAHYAGCAVAVNSSVLACPVSGNVP